MSFVSPLCVFSSFNSISSLIETIRLRRPELVKHRETDAHPIPDEPAQDYFKGLPRSYLLSSFSFLFLFFISPVCASNTHDLI